MGVLICFLSASAGCVHHGPASIVAEHRARPGRLAVDQTLRACLSVRFQGFTPTPPYRPSASSRLWPARAAALRLPDPCGLGSDSHGGKVFSGKLLEFLTQTGSEDVRIGVLLRSVL